MPGFYGFRYVLADLHKHLRTGKVMSGTLRARALGSGDQYTSVSWANIYVWPQTETSGFMGKGHSDIDGTITLWRVGETNAPRADDLIVIGATTWLITHVTQRLNADESANFAVYDCVVANSQFT